MSDNVNPNWPPPQQYPPAWGPAAPPPQYGAPYPQMPPPGWGPPPQGPPPQRPKWVVPVIVAAAIVAVVLLVGGVVAAVMLMRSDSDSSASETSSEQTTTSVRARETPRPSRPRATPAPAAELTIADYVLQNNITETPIRPGDAGAPTLDLPYPPGFEDAGERTPEWAYGAIVSTDPAFSADPATVIAIFSKLTGNVDPEAILRYAPNELRNLPGFQGGPGDRTQLSGFPAFQIGGSYLRDGARRAIAQKTVVIEGGDGLYVLQLNADGTPEQQPALIEATAVIDEQTVITP